MTTVDDNSLASLQRAVDLGTGTIHVPKGYYQFGSESLRINEHRVQLICEPGTMFNYTGPSAAVIVGDDGKNTEGFQLSGADINISGNSNDEACCLKLIRSFWASLRDIRLTSDNGASAPRQKGLMISGGATDEAGFSAYTLVENMAVIGSFKTCVWLGSEIPGGPSTTDRSNANTFIGGSVYCGASSKVGSIGFHIQHGDTNRILGVDHDSLETGIKIDGHNNQANCRFENISGKAVHVGSTSQGSFIFGCSIPAGEWLDEGYETQFIITSQAGENRTTLTDLAGRYSLRLIPRGGDPQNVEDGMLWYDWETGTIKARIAGATKTLTFN